MLLKISKSQTLNCEALKITHGDIQNALEYWVKYTKNRTQAYVCPNDIIGKSYEQYTRKYDTDLNLKNAFNL